MTTSRWACVLVVGLAALSAGCSDDAPLKDGPEGQAGDDGAEPDAGSGDETNGGMTAGGNSNNDPGATGGSGGAGAGAGGAASGGNPNNVPTAEDGLVGDYCEADADCSNGMTCLLESTPFFSEGTIAGGFCTSTCESPEACQALDNRSDCFTSANGTPEDETDDTSYCMDTCSVGVAGNCDYSESAPRIDRYCQGLDQTGASNEGVCLPRCYGDASCPDGVCDGLTGACVQERRAGMSLGETCAEPADCSGGICYLSAPDSGTGVCTELCVYAPYRGACGQPADGDAPPDFLCVPDINKLQSDAPFADLDLGVCSGTCDEDEDCGHEGFICSPFTEEAAAELGRKGLCLQAIAFDDGMGGMGGMGAGGAGGGAGGTGGAPQADAGAP